MRDDASKNSVLPGLVDCNREIAKGDLGQARRADLE
jgi:hypothetical protein